MKTASRGVIFLAIALLSTPILYGQDLSKYRNFALGSTSADLVRQLALAPSDARVIHERPALIQEISWRPDLSREISVESDSVDEILFSLYNGTLYRMKVAYSSSATEGMTPADMVQALTASYGKATFPAARTTAAAVDFAPGSSEKVIARWEDPQHSMNLYRDSLLETYGVVIYTRLLDAQSASSIAKSVELERQTAPQAEAARLKDEAATLEEKRQKNKKAFHP